MDVSNFLTDHDNILLSIKFVSGKNNFPRVIMRWEKVWHAYVGFLLCFQLIRNISVVRFSEKFSTFCRSYGWPLAWLVECDETKKLLHLFSTFIITTFSRNDQSTFFFETWQINRTNIESIFLRIHIHYHLLKCSENVCFHFNKEFHEILHLYFVCQQHPQA